MDDKEFGAYELQYRDYAKAFWNELTTALWPDSGSLKYLPIVIVNSTHIKNGDKVYGVTHTHINTATNIGMIYPKISIIDVHATEDVKSAIRHEAIHYLLGILFKNGDDSSALFWLICDVFNGNAYSPMDSSNQIVFDIAKPYFKQIYDMHRSTKNERVATNFSLMLTAIDTIESSSPSDLDRLALQLKSCIECATIACS
jgi:hypothetical protein